MDSGGFLFDGSSHGNTLFVGNGDCVFRGPRSVLFSMEEALKNRPFFTAREEVEEDYYGDDRHMPEKKRRLTAEQVYLLERSFEAENKLEPERKAQLAKKLGLQPRQVAVWFQNRRARWKTKQLERDFDLLRSSYQSLIADYDLAVKENLRLKSEVTSLTEKLQAHEPVDPKENPLPENVDVPPIAVNIKAEDRQSTGSSGGSAVVDGDDDDGPQLLVDSGDSYFPDDDGYTGCGRMGPMDGIQSEEEEEGSDDSRSYFVTAAAAEQQHPTTTDDEPLGWFWS